jgi:CDP-diacylglycerol--serine O-phosphatidyltransferase
MTFSLGFVMVSNFRYRSFKDIDFRHRLPFRYLVTGVFLFALVAIRPETTLFVLFLTYATLGAVFGIWRLRLRPPLMKPYSQDPGEDLHEVIEESQKA